MDEGMCYCSKLSVMCFVMGTCASIIMFGALNSKPHFHLDVSNTANGSSVNLISPIQASSKMHFVCVSWIECDYHQNEPWQQQTSLDLGFVSSLEINRIEGFRLIRNFMRTTKQNTPKMLTCFVNEGSSQFVWHVVQKCIATENMPSRRSYTYAGNCENRITSINARSITKLPCHSRTITIRYWWIDCMHICCFCVWPQFECNINSCWPNIPFVYSPNELKYFAWIQIDSEKSNFHSKNVCKVLKLWLALDISLVYFWHWTPGCIFSS